MAVTLKQSKKLSKIRLQGAVDIASAAELKQLLIAALGSGKEVHVDLMGAADLDVTAMQLLWAARREAQSSDAGFKLFGEVPEPIRLALRDAGLEELAVTTDASQAIEVNPCQT